MINIKDRRLAATVTHVFYGVEDHGVLTAYVRLEFGGEQGFGGIVLDEERTGPAFKRQIVELFGTPAARLAGAKLEKAWQELIGRQCFVLRCWGGWNDRIDGLEVDGKRFIMRKFIREMWPNRHEPTEFEARQASCISTIGWALRRAQEETQRLATLKDDFYDWENAGDYPFDAGTP